MTMYWLSPVDNTGRRSDKSHLTLPQSICMQIGRRITGRSGVNIYIYWFVYVYKFMSSRVKSLH